MQEGEEFPIEHSNGNQSLSISLSDAIKFSFEYSDAYTYEDKEHILSDGTKLVPDSRIGKLTIEPTPAKVGESADEYLERVKKSTIQGLQNLAHLCKTDPRFERINVFGGFSHIARFGEAFGFDVYPIENEWLKEKETFISNRFARSATSNNPLLRSVTQKEKEAKAGFISKKKLLEIYGSHEKE